MDLSKLPAAPWEILRGGYSLRPDEYSIWPEGANGDGDQRIACWIKSLDVAEFICLARNAEVIMMRRGWTAMRYEEGWSVDATWDGSDDEDNWRPDAFQSWLDGRFWDHPFVALAEANAWMTEQENTRKD